MRSKVLVLGAGFGGLELSWMLSQEFGDDAGVTLIDAGDGFTFGFAKLDVMFGAKTAEQVLLPYDEIKLPGVSFRQERITRIDPEAKRVTTDAGVHEADTLVIALGADYDIAATPGLADANEFYSVAGAAELAPVIADFSRGDVLIGIADAPFKCPPAPSECALLMHDTLTRRGVRDDCTITLVMPFGIPIPPSPDTSAALLSAFEERGIEFVRGLRLAEVDADRGVARFDDGSERPFDLLLGVPKHHAPQVVLDSGLARDGYIPVRSSDLRTELDDVYALGDCATVGVPKAGIFAEGAARVVAKDLIARRRDADGPAPYDGRGACYIEFGAGAVARVDIDFLSGPEKTGTFNAPSAELRAEKDEFGSSRAARWFG